MIEDSLYIAVDLGAGSGRVFLAGMAPGELLLEEVRRFQFPPRRSEGGRLRWSLREIFREIKVGLLQAGKIAQTMARPIRSIGVDSWAVDYGLIDDRGELLEDPICYRDERTAKAMEEVFARISREEIFARTGIQFLPFNTLYQLYTHGQAGIPVHATSLLLIPDLINFFLTGRSVAEYTNATTTQLVNAQTGGWDLEVMRRLGLRSDLLAEMVPAGTDLGPLKPALAEELGLDRVRVIAPATHDTASAVSGAPLEKGWAYVSSGTWSLVGVEREEVLINNEVLSHNFTNEGGAFRTVRFLKNVMGLWIFESCRKEWMERGLEVDYNRLLSQVEAREPATGLIFPDDPRFFNPSSMLLAIGEQLAESDEDILSDPPGVTRIILDSLAFRYASVLRILESLTGRKIEGVQIVGGGSQNSYLNQMTANVTAKTVVAGPVEATVTGNVLVQAVAAGRFASITVARRHVAENVSLKKFFPRQPSMLKEQDYRYRALEARYLH